uniref:Methyltransferase domain-containing protein n=2 Tax=Phytophthora ramorum TaxID=164328 RepID=H3HDN5_PHYRM
MPLSTIVAAVTKSSANAVMPLVLTSAGITSYARYAATHSPAESTTSNPADLEHEREEHLHQHVALPWKGTRCITSPPRCPMLAPRKTLYSTPLSAFRRALALVHVQASDVVYDLGCGDGRLLIEAARSFGVRAVGVEIDPKRAQQARDAAQREGVDHLVTVHQANALEFDIPTDATVVFLFLIGRGLSLVRPKLEKLAGLGPADVVFPVYIYHFPTSTSSAMMLPRSA